MKYYYLLLFTITTLQTACYSQENRIFVDPTEKYEIQIPKEWTIKKLSGSNLLVRASGKSPIKFFTLVIAKSETSWNRVTLLLYIKCPVQKVLKL